MFRYEVEPSTGRGTISTKKCRTSYVNRSIKLREAARFSRDKPRRSVRRRLVFGVTNDAEIVVAIGGSTGSFIRGRQQRETGKISWLFSCGVPSRHSFFNGSPRDFDFTSIFLADNASANQSAIYESDATIGDRNP
jgi:hypothetical protein